MGAFCRGFQYGLANGFYNGLLNGLWGGFGCGNFFMPRFSSYCCFNPISLYMVPPVNFSMYSSPNSEYVFNTPMPSVNFNFNLDSFQYTQPQQSFQYSFIDNCKFTVPQFSFNSPSTSSSSSNTPSLSAPEKSKSKPAQKTNTTTKKIYWYEMTDTELRNIYGNYTRDITKPYNGNAAQLNKYLKNQGVLEGKGQAFIDAQNKYGISAAVLVGICINESAHGKSLLAKNNNNVGGVRIAGSTEFRKFDKVEDCIDYMGNLLKSGYVNNSKRSLTKLYEINARYCPVSDPTDDKKLNSGWARAVEKYAKEVENIA